MFDARTTRCCICDGIVARLISHGRADEYSKQQVPVSDVAEKQRITMIGVLRRNVVEETGPVLQPASVSARHLAQIVVELFLVRASSGARAIFKILHRG